MWSVEDRKLLRSLRRPALIQDFLDSLHYNTDDVVRSPQAVLRSRKAHCLDGALLAAVALELHGEDAYLVSLYADHRDDDHVIVCFRRGAYWGAVAKSNFVTLRWRDPVFKSVRELALSYFGGYFNLKGEKTLVAFSAPLALSRLDTIAHLHKRGDWRYGAEDISVLGDYLDVAKRFAIIRPPAKELRKADARELKAATLGLDRKGAFGG